MGIDIDKLEALARAATPGPWDTDEGGEVHSGGRTVYAKPWLDGKDQKDADMRYGAAADPTAILTLISRLRESEAREQCLRQHLNAKWSDYVNGVPCAEIRWQQKAGTLRGERDDALREAGYWKTLSERLSRDKQVLAAHVRALVEWADSYVGTTGLYEEVEAARKADTASLARLKLGWKAEALEDAADNSHEPADSALGMCHVSAWLRSRAAEYRRQAEEGSHE